MRRTASHPWWGQVLDTMRVVKNDVDKFYSRVAGIER